MLFDITRTFQFIRLFVIGSQKRMNGKRRKSTVWVKFKSPLIKTCYYHCNYTSHLQHILSQSIYCNSKAIQNCKVIPSTNKIVPIFTHRNIDIVFYCATQFQIVNKRVNDKFTLGRHHRDLNWLITGKYLDGAFSFAVCQYGMYMYMYLVDVNKTTKLKYIFKKEITMQIIYSSK